MEIYAFAGFTSYRIEFMSLRSCRKYPKNLHFMLITIKFMEYFRIFVVFPLWIFVAFDFIENIHDVEQNQIWREFIVRFEWEFIVQFWNVLTKNFFWFQLILILQHTHIPFVSLQHTVSHSIRKIIFFGI